MKKSILTIITLSVGLIVKAQQVPNGGFENWIDTTVIIPPFSVSYMEPQKWQTLNVLVGSNSVKPIEKSTEKTSGSFSLLAKNVKFQNFTGLDTAIGFAYTKIKVNQSPSSITFNYKSDIKGSKDTVFVSAIGTKWNTNTLTSENVLFAVGAYTTNQATFKFVTLPFFGFSGLTPDSVNIVISSSGKFKKFRTPETSIWVDDLSLNFGPLSLNESYYSDNIDNKIYPSPATEFIYIKGTINDETSYRLFNSQGIEVKNGFISSSLTEINTHDQPKGLYFVETYSDSGIRVSKNKIVLK